MVMPLTDVKTAIDKEDKQSVQFRAEGNTALTFPGQGGAFGDLWGFAFRLAGDSEGLPAWWSPMRDKFLRAYTRHNPILSSVIRGEKARVRNMSYTLSLEDGRSRKINRYHDMLRDCDFGKGFRSFSEKLAGDLLSLDNGGFIELIGKGGNRETQRPLDKADIDTFAYLDSVQCLSRDSRVLMADGSTKAIIDIVRNKTEADVLSLDQNGNLVPKPITGWHETPLAGRHWLRIKLESGKYTFGRKEGLWLTNDHQVLTECGWVRADELTLDDRVMTPHPALNEKQARVLVGSLLGDGSLRSVNKKNHRLTASMSFIQGIRQLEWLKLKESVFKGFKFSPPKENIRYPAIYSETTPALADWYQDWYPNGKKRIPRGLIEDNFSPIMLATWYLDDGDMHSGNNPKRQPAARLSTNGFLKEDVEWLADLLTRHGYTATIHLKRTHEYTIYITVAGAKKFFKDIGAFVPPTMRYKVPSWCDEFESDLWETEEAPRYASPIESIEKGDLAGQTGTFCIDVADNHNFIAGGMVVHNCWRTYDPEYPVVYTSPYNGSYHIMHYTRVIALADNEQGDELARGIGLSAASRAFEIARYIFDMETYKREKVSGESPEIWLLNGPMSVKQFQQGLITGKMSVDNQGTVKFKNGVIVGPPGTTGANNQPTTLTSVGIKNVPDGFNFKDELTVAMYILAMAFNVDIREYFPLQAGGATRADAGIQHEKSSGKGRATIWTLIEDAINYRVLPDYVTFQYDIQDDIEDKQKAEIKQIRANARATQIQSGELSVPEARIMAAEAGDIDPDFLENPIVADDTTAPGEGSAGNMENEQAEDEIEVESTNPVEGEKSDSPKVVAVADKGIGGTRAFFATDMSQIVEQAKPYGGNLRQGQFGSQLRRIISTASIQALLDGFRDGGVVMRINEISDVTANELNEHIMAQWNYADAFTESVFNGLTKEAALGRIPLWVSKCIDEIYFTGLLHAKLEQKFKWEYGETRHCDDCKALDGKVYRARDWIEAKIKPRISDLACGGYNCKCKLVKTDEPLSEGKPTLVSGGVGGFLHDLRKPSKRKLFEWPH